MGSGWLSGLAVRTRTVGSGQLSRLTVSAQVIHSPERGGEGQSLNRAVRDGNRRWPGRACSWLAACWSLLRSCWTPVLAACEPWRGVWTCESCQCMWGAASRGPVSSHSSTGARSTGGPDPRGCPRQSRGKVCPREAMFARFAWTRGARAHPQLTWKPRVSSSNCVHLTWASWCRVL